MHGDGPPLLHNGTIYEIKLHLLHTLHDYFLLKRPRMSGHRHGTVKGMGRQVDVQDVTIPIHAPDPGMIRLYQIKLYLLHTYRKVVTT